ncbi:Uncharacterized conserved protein, DUF1697 family [Tenacibaculum sp. MAR_2009_124]|uniref:DUF1697 domain-containing protein n=1 Tax=Tenacibaculum sp. MAR_2009_124 TaxID=1250059 RepID=UPI000895B988|nr:DUF1697 domain-containing protein [Tenacibaculum sp. MAR_2009_124]SEC86481.1 Uncharacterized conserved protein, DUF1697 family [Tenacibaculum sp. MAR_2009_124]
MYKYIVILRGINVSGKNKLPMKDLKQLLEKLNYKDVITYIQSGNVLLKTEETRDKVAININNAIKKEFDYEVPILVRTIEEWKEAIEKNPYRKAAEKQQYFTFLAATPKENLIEVNAKDDEFEIIKDVVYVNAVGGYGKTKLSNGFFEKKLGVTATTRNLKTTLKLLELANC